MKIETIRHGTVILDINGLRLLVDPVLGEKGTMPAIKDVPNTDKNPLVDLPVPVTSIINCDAVLVTHTHSDHFDGKAAELLPKGIPLFCQPEDEGKIREKGFKNVTAVHSDHSWDGITFHRTGGRHGHGAIAVKMAPVSGFVITAREEPSVYIAGDTVWCSCVRKAMHKYKPDIMVCNCGEARFSTGRAITMGTGDIQRICSFYPDVKVVAVHMEAWNHCRLTREALTGFLKENQWESRVSVPSNGDSLIFK